MQMQLSGLTNQLTKNSVAFPIATFTNACVCGSFYGVFVLYTTACVAGGNGDDVQMISTYPQISLNTSPLCCHCCEWTVLCGVSPHGMTMANRISLITADLVDCSLMFLLQ